MADVSYLKINERSNVERPILREYICMYVILLTPLRVARFFYKLHPCYILPYNIYHPSRPLSHLLSTLLSRRIPLARSPICVRTLLTTILTRFLQLSRSLARSHPFSDFRVPLFTPFLFIHTFIPSLLFSATFSVSFTFPFSLLCSPLLSSLSSSSPPIFSLYLPLYRPLASTSLLPNTLSFHSLSTSHISPLRE